MLTCGKVNVPSSTTSSDITAADAHSWSRMSQLDKALYSIAHISKGDNVRFWAMGCEDIRAAELLSYQLQMRGFECTIVVMPPGDQHTHVVEIRW